MTDKWIFTMADKWIRLKQFHNAVSREQTYHQGSPVDHKVIDTYLPAFFEAVSPEEKDITILDMGCGSGYAMKKMKDMGFENVSGITMHEDSVAEGKLFGLDIDLMDYNFMTFDDSSFDVLWARQSLHYSPFPFFTIVEMNRVMKTGGWAYIEIPEPADSTYYATLHVDTYKKLFQRAGFEVIQQDSYELTAEEAFEKHNFIIVSKQISLTLPEFEE